MGEQAEEGRNSYTPLAQKARCGGAASFGCERRRRGAGVAYGNIPIRMSRILCDPSPTFAPPPTPARKALLVEALKKTVSRESQKPYAVLACARTGAGVGGGSRRRSPLTKRALTRETLMEEGGLLHHRRLVFYYRGGMSRIDHIQITGRDLAVLEAVHRYRALSRAQIERRFFPPRAGHVRRPGEASKAHERLRLLFQHGYVERVHRYGSPGHPNPGPAYRLARRGAEVLAQRKGIPVEHLMYWGKGDDRDRHPTQVGPLYLEHTLQLADVRMRMAQAAASNGCQIETWRDHVDLQREWATETARVRITWSSTQSREVAVTPDGYVLLRAPQGYGHWFLELDRGTKTIRQTWKKKVLMYKEYVRSEKFHQRYHVPTHVRFRVLVIAPSPTRAENIRKAAETYGPPDLASLFLCASFPDVMGNDPLTAPIWQRGGRTTTEALL